MLYQNQIDRFWIVKENYVVLKIILTTIMLWILNDNKIDIIMKIYKKKVIN